MFGRLFAWLANDVIIHTLSNSKKFQQFAMRTDASLTKHKDTLHKHVVAPGEKLLKDKTKEVKNIDLNGFIAQFKKELTSEMEKNVKNKK